MLPAPEGPGVVHVDATSGWSDDALDRPVAARVVGDVLVGDVEDGIVGCGCGDAKGDVHDPPKGPTSR